MMQLSPSKFDFSLSTLSLSLIHHFILVDLFMIFIVNSCVLLSIHFLWVMMRFNLHIPWMYRKSRTIITCTRCQICLHVTWHLKLVVGMFQVRSTQVYMQKKITSYMVIIQFTKHPSPASKVIPVPNLITIYTSNWSHTLCAWNFNMNMIFVLSTEEMSNNRHKH